MSPSVEVKEALLRSLLLKLEIALMGKVSDSSLKLRSWIELAEAMAKLNLHLVVPTLSPSHSNSNLTLILRRSSFL